MNENIYMLPDTVIAQKIGKKLRHMRLRQNYTQQKLGEDAQVSLSTIKKIEHGEIGSFDSFIRISEYWDFSTYSIPCLRMKS